MLILLVGAVNVVVAVAVAVDSAPAGSTTEYVNVTVAAPVSVGSSLSKVAV